MHFPEFNILAYANYIGYHLTCYTEYLTYLRFSSLTYYIFDNLRLIHYAIFNVQSFQCFYTLKTRYHINIFIQVLLIIFYFFTSAILNQLQQLLFEPR